MRRHPAPTVPALLLGLTIAGLGGSAAGCRPNESMEGQARDAKIKTQIKSKLASDVGASTLTSIQVNVTNGVVTLSGPVHSQDEKARAEASARSVDGVVSVTNALQILTGEPVASGPTTTSVPGSAPTRTPNP